MTAPGQTAGLSVFTDPLIEELSIDRSAISLSYLIGTLAGAAAQPLIGRASDRWDVRKVIIGIGLCFAAVLFALSFVTEVLGLTAGFVGVRMAGQGALSLAVTTAVARSVTHRRGLALGISAAIGSAGISLAPIGMERLVSIFGMDATWRLQAVAVLVIVTVAALLIRPACPASGSPSEQVSDGWTVREARRTGMFWLIAAAVSTTSMLGTGLMFHQIAVLGEQGLSSFEAAANFLPQTVTALLATLLVGSLIDRQDPRIFVVTGMAAMASALLFLPLASPGWTAVMYGLILGVAGGTLRGMEAAAFARYYGVAHIGAIRGLATLMSLAASAVGPYLLALGAELTGGFALPSAAVSALPIGVIVAAFIVKPPQRSLR